jgi:hypothetical protein
MGYICAGCGEALPADTLCPCAMGYAVILNSLAIRGKRRSPCASFDPDGPPGQFVRQPHYLASSSRTQVPGQAARAVACLTLGVVSTVVRQRPWLVVVEVTHLVTRHLRDRAGLVGISRSLVA